MNALNYRRLAALGLGLFGLGCSGPVMDMVPEPSMPMPGDDGGTPLDPMAPPSVDDDAGPLPNLEPPAPEEHVDSSPNDDTLPSSPVEPAPPPDEVSGPLLIVSSNVAPGDSRVSVLTTFELVASRALNAATVNEDTVTLRDYQGQPVRGRVGYDDATKTIIFDPRSPLEHRSYATTSQHHTQYVLSLRGVVGEHGETMSDVTIGFRTFSNAVARATFYDEGRVTRYATYALDYGTSTGSTWYGSPGDDAVWFTADDLRDGRSINQIDEFGRVRRSILFDQDETVDGYLDYRYDEVGRELAMIAFQSPGRDESWFTSDDEPFFPPRSREFDEVGNEVLSVELADSGVDQVWFTQDDGVRGYGTTTYFGDDGWTQVQFSGPGADGIWFDADDEIAYWQRRERVSGDSQSMVYVGDPGLDGNWMTEDDIVNSRQLDELNADGQIVRQGSVDGPGIDNEWYTADDDIAWWTITEYDANGNETCVFEDAQSPAALRYLRNRDGLVIESRAANGTGPDDVWCTDDDQLTIVERYTYDQAGNRITGSYVLGSGLDGTWNTADDAIAAVIEYDIEPPTPALTLILDPAIVLR